MRIYLMTDLEGVCGVINAEDWCLRGSRYYDRGKVLLTEEVNAAVEGFLAGGADEVLVADGHGAGALDGTIMHPKASLMRGWPRRWPFLMEEKGYDAVAWVGQHPKAGTINGHLCHTQSFGYRDESVNGVSIGEYGQFGLCAGELGVPAVFASGCVAFTKEAEAMVPGIETVAVKRGTQLEPGHNLPREAYSKHNSAAIHLPIAQARERIREGAQRAAERFKAGENRGLMRIDPPYERVTVMRSDATHPPQVSRNQHPSSIIELFQAPFEFKPIDLDPLVLAD